MLLDAAQPGVEEPSSVRSMKMWLRREVYIRLRKFTRRRDGERCGRLSLLVGNCRSFGRNFAGGGFTEFDCAAKYRPSDDIFMRARETHTIMIAIIDRDHHV